MAHQLFWVRRDGVKHVGISFDRKIKTPASGNSGLPEIARLVVFFGVQGRVAKILEKELDFSIKGFLDCGGSAIVHPQKLFSAPDAHYAFFFDRNFLTSRQSARTKSFAEL